MTPTSAHVPGPWRCVCRLSTRATALRPRFAGWQTGPCAHRPGPHPASGWGVGARQSPPAWWRGTCWRCCRCRQTMPIRLWSGWNGLNKDARPREPSSAPGVTCTIAFRHSVLASFAIKNIAVGAFWVSARAQKHLIRYMSQTYLPQPCGLSLSKPGRSLRAALRQAQGERACLRYVANQAKTPANAPSAADVPDAEEPPIPTFP